MKILVATDGSAHNKAMIKKFADRTFATNTKVRIITAYDVAYYMRKIAPTGLVTDYHGEVDKYLKKTAENTSESAATILRK
ncbi:MAG: universal stress protein [Bacteroidia bacterium]